MVPTLLLEEHMTIRALLFNAYSDLGKLEEQTMIWIGEMDLTILHRDVSTIPKDQETHHQHETLADFTPDPDITYYVIRNGSEDDELIETLISLPRRHHLFQFVDPDWTPEHFCTTRQKWVREWKGL